MPTARLRHPVQVEQLTSAVAYDGLPISSGGAHALGRVSAADALGWWLRFLNTRTEPSPVQSHFSFPETPDLKVERKVRRLIKREFPASSRHGNVVARDRFDDALRLFESLEPLPTNPFGMAPVWLWFTADFRMLSPRNDEVWPGQDPARFGNFETPAGVTLGASSTRLILQAKRSMGLTLSIPNASDADLTEVVPWIQIALPMRLSRKHWTRWSLTKNGSSYRGKRIEPPVGTGNS